MFNKCSSVKPHIKTPQLLLKMLSKLQREATKLSAFTHVQQICV